MLVGKRFHSIADLYPVSVGHGFKFLVMRDDVLLLVEVEGSG